MRIYKTKWLARFARREGIADASMRAAVERAEQGSVDTDLGGGLIKMRVGRAGKGRSGGYRLIVAYRAQSRAVFLYGFAKNERENVTPNELEDLRELGRNWLRASQEAITRALDEGMLQEVNDEGQKGE